MPLPEWTAHARYLTLTTTRRDGREVSTAVWFVADGDELRVLTGATSGKVKRIAHTAAVTAAPSDSRGRPQQPSTPFTASIRPELATDTEAAINRRYGLQARAFGAVTTVLSKVRRRDVERTALVLRPV